MKSSFLNLFKGYARQANEWLLKTPERALEDAYEAAQRIRTLEENHFNGDRISLNAGGYSKSVQDYFQAELKKNLETARVRLTEFKASSSVIRLSNRTITEIELAESPEDTNTVNIIDKPALILQKLRLIDEILERYSPKRFIADPPSRTLVIEATDTMTPTTERSPIPSQPDNSNDIRPKAKPKEEKEYFADKTGVLPRSILRTVDRIKQELDPKAEDQVVETFRDSKARTIISLRFILILIIIPLLTQQVSKNFLVGPIVDQFWHGEESVVFLNTEMEEEALDELHRFEERLRFEVLLGKAPNLSEAQIDERVLEKVEEIEDEYRHRSSDSIKNLFSDIFSVVAFVGVFVVSQEEIAVLKSFIDELIYGLSDSAKAFIIILFTDTFVGFHSPHGWEIILEGISRHFGLPANRDFIFLFIATFPVILDTVFKYWIFRYLNRISPSAVATYKNMNE